MHALFQLILAGTNPWGIVLFRDADAGVAEQDRHLIDGNAGQQHLDSEGIAEHVTMAALWRVVRFAEIGDFKEPAIGTLPIGDEGFWKAVAGPEEVIRIRFEAGGIERSRSATWGGSGTKTGVPVFA